MLIHKLPQGRTRSENKNAKNAIPDPVPSVRPSVQSKQALSVISVTVQKNQKYLLSIPCPIFQPPLYKSGMPSHVNCSLPLVTSLTVMPVMLRTVHSISSSLIAWPTAFCPSKTSCRL